jgi:hypothetical protein
LGLLQVCHPERLDVGTLRFQIAEALKVNRKLLKARAQVLDFNGARRTASCLLKLAQVAMDRNPPSALPKRLNTAEPARRN